MTAYCVRYRVRHTGREGVTRFETATMRALFVIGYGPYVEVLAQWEERDPDVAHAEPMPILDPVAQWLDDGGFFGGDE